MRLLGMAVVAWSSGAYADDATNRTADDGAQVEMSYDEIRDLGQVSITSPLNDDCGQVVGFGVIYMTKGEPQTSKRYALQPTLAFTVDREFDVGDFSDALKRRVTVPYLIDGKRGGWRGEFGSKVADCDVQSKTCIHNLRVHVAVTKADLQRLARAKRAKLRPFDGVDCELNAVTKEVFARFLKTAPALK